MTQFTTLPCSTCGHSVAREAKRCPSCDAKRPAPTPANLVRAIGGLAVLVVVLVAMVGGCSGGAGVDWSKYPGWHQQVDQLAADHECEGLQARFDLADQRYLDSDLLKYIGDKMDSTGCYG